MAIGPPELLTKLRKEALYKDGVYQGPCPQSIKDANSDCGWFGKDVPVPEGRTVLATQDTVDSWLAAHYGMKLENVPSYKGKGIPTWVYDWIKRTQFEEPKNRKTKNENKMIQLMPKEASTSVAHVYSYQTSPTKFGQLSYPSKMRINTISGSRNFSPSDDKIDRKQSPGKDSKGGALASKDRAGR